MKTILLLSMFGVGIALYAIGEVTSAKLAAENVWTDEKASRLVEVNDQLAKLAVLQREPISMHSGPDRGVAQRELLDLIREKEQLTADFEAALKGRIVSFRPWSAAGIFVTMCAVLVSIGMFFRKMSQALPNQETASD